MFANKQHSFFRRSSAAPPPNRRKRRLSLSQTQFQTASKAPAYVLPFRLPRNNFAAMVVLLEAVYERI